MSRLRLCRGTQRLLSILVSVWTLLYSSCALPRTRPPMLPHHHFMFVWNAPSELCVPRYNISLDLSYFSLVSSTLKTATNQSLSMFYIDRFGIFPYVDEDTGEMYEDGLPHLIDLQEHREEAEDDIEYYIPTNISGFAVLDFEEWRPQWDRNWGSKDIYRDISTEKVMKKNPSLSEDKAEDQAKLLFERGAKRYFIRSLRLGKRMRPNRLWGYYLYPDCYNYDYNHDMMNFTGECPKIEEQRNDELLWLWKESTALFPSIYLELVLKDSEQARSFVRHRIQEAIRVSTLPNSSYSIPIYPFIRPVYKDSVDHYMSELDLVNTIGEAAALGTAGVISWGDMDLTDTEASCLDAQNHLKQVMNPYILNVTTATRLCSQALCQSKGRCVRKNWDSNVFLHLHPRRFKIWQRSRGGPLTVSGRLTKDDIKFFNQNFNCLCYSEEPCRSLMVLNGKSKPVVTPRGRSAASMASLPLLLILLCLRYSIV